MNGLAVELMQNINQIEIMASAFDLGSFDNCGLEEYLIASPSQGPGQNTPPASAATSIIFDCDDVGTQTVDFWLKDIAGNWGYCSTYIIIQDNLVACSNPTNAGIAGVISNEAGATVEAVQVNLNGTAPGIPDPNITGANGNYGFPDLPLGYDYTIEPTKDDDPLNGVSTFDLVLMNKHILGTQKLNSPYKIIAADINKSGTVSTFDLVLLRRMILQIDESFTANTSWRFVEAAHVFPNVENPFATVFPEILEVNQLGQPMSGDFIAIKTGDVNGNAVTSNFAISGEDRNMEAPLLFTVEDELLNPGRSYQVDFRAGDIKNMRGYQFTLSFDTEQLIFNDIIPGHLPGLTLDNFGFSKLNDGALTTSWNQHVDLGNFDAEEILFSLVFEAKRPVTWSESLDISSRFTRAEAYDANAEILNVALAFETLETERNSFEIYPNQPNPFAQETLISFNLPEATPLDFSIQDVSGKIVQSQELDAPAGYNEILINRKDLNGPGIYFYTIKTKTHRVSQRMILIKK